MSASGLGHHGNSSDPRGSGGLIHQQRQGLGIECHQFVVIKHGYVIHLVAVSVDGGEVPQRLIEVGGFQLGTDSVAAHLDSHIYL